MKHAVLKSIAHNFVDSYGNGMGFLIGLYEMRVYEEAAKCDEGIIEIDFLTGEVSGGSISENLRTATHLYRAKLPEFCAKHSATLDDFRIFIARFWNEYDGRHCSITVKDSCDRISTSEFVGDPPTKKKVVDGSGRIRTRS